MQLEILDVDALRAQRLRNAGEHAWAVGHVPAQALQLAGVRVLALEHATAIARGLPDPARKEPRVALLERLLDLLDATAMLGELAADALGVVEEDVDPDPWVRARDARHVAQRPACVRQRLVPLDA